jgi:hypothetical protein
MASIHTLDWHLPSLIRGTNFALTVATMQCKEKLNEERKKDSSVLSYLYLESV